MPKNEDDATANTEVFTVEARDQDLGVANAVLYGSISIDNGGDFFMEFYLISLKLFLFPSADPNLDFLAIGETTGVVTLTKDLNREDYGANNYFEVTYIATEDGCADGAALCTVQATTTFRLDVKMPEKVRIKYTMSHFQDVNDEAPILNVNSCCTEIEVNENPVTLSFEGLTATDADPDADNNVFDLTITWVSLTKA